MNAFVAVVLECKDCKGRWVTDEEDMKRCDYCNSKWGHKILWKANTGIFYE